MTPEGKVKKEIKAYLDSIGAYHIWPVPTGYGPKLVDCYACLRGRFVAIEVKAPGKMPTKYQSLEITRMNHALGIAFAAGDFRQLARIGQDDRPLTVGIGADLLGGLEADTVAPGQGLRLAGKPRLFDGLIAQAGIQQ